MYASSSAVRVLPHFSHSFFISSAMRSDDCRQILRNWNAQNEFNYHEGAEDVDLREANAASNFRSHGTTVRVTYNAFARTCFVQREFRPTADVDPRARRSRGKSRAAGIAYCGACCCETI